MPSPPEPEAGTTLDVLEPATAAVLASVPRAGVKDVDAAVARARAAYPSWRAVAPGDRSAVLRRVSDAVRDHLEELAVLEARNAGKPIGDARGEMDVFAYYAGAPERLLGDSIPVSGGHAWTVREPLGVVGLIVPWNFPLTIAAWKQGPALAAGNTVVLKPAELTPDPADRAARAEIFGPVAVVIGFDDEEEAVRLANDTIYGLSGSIWSRDGGRALRVARALEAGVLSINSNTSVRVATPFGGFKQSGYGRELGPHALDAYTEVKSIFYATS
jgi:acyl-CoA reductase-like NAD-dependent aldehyde dehydrogenase